MTKSGVKKPSKNRKKLSDVPYHQQRKSMSATLSPELRVQYGFRSIPIRKGDNVLITKGDRKLTEGRAIQVDVKKKRIFIEGVNRQRMDGSNVQLTIRPANIMITRLNLDDEDRRKILERRSYKSKQS